MFTPQNEVNRMMFNNQQHPQFPQQQRMNHNSDINHVHPSMSTSKFFDFHKQQQNQQQNQFMVNPNPMAEQHNMANLENHHRMNGPNSFMDQSHVQKQRLLNKYDGNIPFNAGNQNRMHNNPSQFSVEDDLGNTLLLNCFVIFK